MPWIVFVSITKSLGAPALKR